MDKSWMLVLLLAAGCYNEGERPGAPGEPAVPGEQPGTPPEAPEDIPPAAPADGARGTDDVAPGTGTDGARPDTLGTRGTEPRSPETPTTPPATGTETPGTPTGTPGTAQTTPGQGAEVDAREAASQALADVHQVHVHELALAQLAKEKSQDPGIKEYAEVMIRDHSSADADLVQLASREGIVIEGADKARYQDQLDTVERLRGLDGPQFDQAYALEMVQSHAKALELVQTSMTTIQDPELRTYFEKIQPALKDHHERAQKLRPVERGT